MKVEREQPGNISRPIHEHMDWMSKTQIATIIQCLLHVSNQVYELHRSLAGWNEPETPTPSSDEESPSVPPE
jgi:hypothetical protein